MKNQEQQPMITAEQVETWHAALPPEVRNWLLVERGLSDEMIHDANIGWDGSKVVLPVRSSKGDWLFAKRREPPGSNVEPKYKYQMGAKAALYGAHLISSGVQEVVICEGELDSLVLRTRGVLAVSTTGGAGTFLEQWASFFMGIPNVYIVYDIDKTGKEGALMVGKLIPHARIVCLPEELGEHGDVTDFFVKFGKSMDDFRQLLQSARTAKEVEEMGERYKSLPPPDIQLDIQKWREVVKELFPECLLAGEIGLSVITQLLINDVRNPFGLVFVGPPSAGKTLVLNLFSGLGELVYSTDNFTPASLVSHASNRKLQDLEKIDLLPRIRHRTVIVRDLAPIFADRQEVLVKNLGVLTRVFDGEGYESDSGVHGKRGYYGDFVFMFLAASTPIQPRVWNVMGSFGNRLYFYGLSLPDKSEDELANLLIQDDFKRKEKMCRSTTCNLISSIWNSHRGGITWDKKSDPIELLRFISRCANLLRHLRGTVTVWSDNEGDKQHHTNTLIEKPTRINQCLYNLARGHAVACGRTQLTEEDLWPCIEVTLNSAPYNRIKLLEAIMGYAGTINTSVAEEAIGCSNPTALKEIETLRILGIVEVTALSKGGVGRPEKIVSIAQSFAWFCSDECKRLRAMKGGSKIDI